MRRLIYLGITLTLVAGCAAPATTTVQPGGTVFRGEVWTWDEQTNVVTLRNGAQNVRVRVTPDQIRLLRLHEVATIRGELAPPEEIAHVTTGPRPMRAVLQGSAQTSEVTGTVSAVDPRGLVTVDTAQGRLTVWTATSDTSGFPVGTPVRVRVSVQPVQMVPITDSASGSASVEPSASIVTTPGEHAVITGRVAVVDPRGAITVESPRGPIVVVMPPTFSAPAGGSVQVRTTLERAQ
jgi:hypothetical protein